MRLARITNTTRAFILEIAGRRVYAADGPFESGDAIRLGKMLWIRLEEEGATHTSENDGPITVICRGAGVGCKCGLDHGDGSDRNEWQHGGAL